MKNNRRLSTGRTAHIALAALVLIFLGSPAAAAVLVDCDGGQTGGDNIGMEGFYLPSFPGAALDGLDLWLSSARAGTYEVIVEARADTYDGLILAQDTVTLTFTADTDDNQLAAFQFPSVPVAEGSTLAFTHRIVSGPSPFVYYAIWHSTQDCGFTQTTGMDPPLSSFRRNGIRGILYGQEATPVDAASWGRIKSSYR